MTKEIHEKYNFRYNISELFKGLTNEYRLTSSSKNELNLIIHNIVENIVKTASKMAQLKNKVTITANELNHAVNVLFPGELLQCAVNSGIKYVTRYEAYKSKKNTKKQSRSKMLDLDISVSRIENLIRLHSLGCTRVGAGAPVYLAAVIDYFLEEILRAAMDNNESPQKKRITPNHISVAIKNDPEFPILLKDMILSGR